MMIGSVRTGIASALILMSTPDQVSSASINSIVHRGMDVILVQGELAFGDERKFIDAALNKERAVVFLGGPGGNLHAGIEIGKAIRLKGFTTAVAGADMCASACAIAWLGGQKRLMSHEARVGFHAAWKHGPDGRPLAAGPGNAFIGSYLTHLGYPAGVIAYVTEAEPDSMTWVTQTRARQVGLDLVVLDQPTTQTREAELPRQSPPTTSSSVPPIVVRPMSPVDWTIQGEWVQAASRADLADAITVGQALRVKNPSVGVFRYANGWYGVVLGPFSPTRGKVALEALLSAGEVPHDSLLTRGDRFISLEWGSVQPRVLGLGAQLEARAITVAKRFYATWSADNATAMTYLRETYEPEVTYFGKTISSEAVIKEKGRFAERWASRRYTTREESLVSRCDPETGDCTVSGVVDWDATNNAGAVRSTGSANFELTVRVKADGARISAEKSDVITRNRTAIRAVSP